MTTTSPLFRTTYAQRAVLVALIRIGGAAKAADVAYEASHSAAYVTSMLDDLVNLDIVRRGNEHPFPVYSTDLATASITPRRECDETAALTVASMGDIYDQLAELRARLAPVMYPLDVLSAGAPDHQASLKSAQDELLRARHYIVEALKSLNRTRSRTLRAYPPA